MSTTNPSPQRNLSWEAQMKDLWATRPYRLPEKEGGKALFAGVCEGMAVRYQIDPTLIRVLLVLISFFGLGSGFFIYVLCYLLFPLPSTKRSAWEDILDGKGSVTAWGALIILVLTSLGSLGSSAVFSLAIIAILFWFLYQRHPEPPVFPSSERPFITDVQPHEKALHRTPPAWDPLGTAPFAWDLPEPGPRPEEKKKRSTGKIMLGVVAIAGILTVGLGGTLLTWSMAHRINPSVGDQHITVNNVADLSPYYETSVGDLTLDLSNLPALNKDTTITLKSGVGDVDLYLPKAVPVEINCSGGLGDKECGSFPTQGPSESAKLTVEFRSAVGDFSVHPPKS